MATIFLGLGSNIEPEANLRRAAALLREAWPDVVFSPVYRTAPREVLDQPEFLNAVARLETSEPPAAVAGRCQDIEEELGKKPPFKFGPRTIDIDVLLYGNEVIETNDLIIPHPRLHERRFVLEPLCQLADSSEQHPQIRASWNDLFLQALEQTCSRVELQL